MKAFLAGICTLSMVLSGVSVSAESDNVQANSTDSQSTEQSVVTEEEKLSEVGSAIEEGIRMKWRENQMMLQWIR